MFMDRLYLVVPIDLLETKVLIVVKAQRMSVMF